MSSSEETRQFKTVSGVRVRHYTEWTDRELRDGVARCERAIERHQTNVTLSHAVRRLRLAPLRKNKERYTKELAKREGTGNT